MYKIKVSKQLKDKRHLFLKHLKQIPLGTQTPNWLRDDDHTRAHHKKPGLTDLYPH